MTTKTKLASALLAWLALVPLDSGATDIRAVNLSPTAIQPWFRSRCFAAPVSSTDWVFFGNIAAYSEFTWPTFEGLMDTTKPGCHKPTVAFTYNVAGMLAPLPDLPDALIVKVRVSASDTRIVGVQVVSGVVIKKGDD
jgi:hypothetical protein